MTVIYVCKFWLFWIMYIYRWVVIASSTLAMKITVLPIRMLQINKLTRIARLLPKCKFWTLPWSIHSFVLQLYSCSYLLQIECWSWVLPETISVSCVFFVAVPPPLPPPFSGKSYMGQMSRFYKKSKAVGCPSFLWILAYPIVHVTFFYPILLESTPRSTIFLFALNIGGEMIIHYHVIPWKDAA